MIVDPLLSRFIGVLGLLLPFALYLAAGRQESLSAYYWTSGKPGFILILLSVAGLLAAFAWAGLPMPQPIHWIALAASLALAVTALVPTSGPLEQVHGTAAVLFFVLAAVLMHQFGERAVAYTIGAGVLWAAAYSWLRLPIYWPEVLAVTAFAVGWLRMGWPKGVL